MKVLNIFVFLCLFLGLLNSKAYRSPRIIYSSILSPETVEVGEKKELETLEMAKRFSSRPGSISKLKFTEEQVSQFSPLYFAVLKGELETVKSLLEKGFDPDQEMIDKSTALMASVHYPEITKLLIKAGADVNQKGSQGETAIHWAASYSKAQSLEILIENGADIHARDIDKRTVLHIAAVGPPIIVSKDSDLELQEKNAREENLKIIQSVLDKGLDPNSRDKLGQTSLHYSAIAHELAIGEILIKAGADINAKTNSGTIALHAASWINYMEYVQMLIEKGSDLNEKDYNGWNALHHSSNPQVAKQLIEKGVDVNEKTQAGNTILHLIARGDNFETHEKAQENRIEILKLVIKQGVNLNEKNNNGDTALHLSARSEKKLITEILIENGADPNIKNHQGELALKKTSILRKTGAHIFSAIEKVKGKSLKRIRRFSKR